MNPSEWRVEERQSAGGRKLYAVYRLRDKDKPDSKDNREYPKNGYTPSKKTAESIAENWNNFGGRV